MKILLDPGHGAGSKNNRGALIGNEGDNNFHYALALRTELEKYENVTVGMTRNKITDDPTLARRSAMGKGYDLFLSLHSNAYSVNTANGSEVFDSIEKPNNWLATKLANEIAKEFLSNRGVKYRAYPGTTKVDYYGVLRGNGATSAMLIEHGFHTNPTEARTYVNKRVAIAQRTAKVLAAHYGLKLKTAPKPTPKPTPKPPANYLKVGDLVNVDGVLHYNSAGARPGRHHKGILAIDIVVQGANYPYHVGGLGWVAANAVTLKNKPTPPKPTPPPTGDLKIEAIKPKTKTIEIYPHMKMNKDTYLYGFNVTNWNDVDKIQQFKKGDVLELADIVTNKLGAKYGRTHYASDNNNYTGFNMVDFDIIWKE